MISRYEVSLNGISLASLNEKILIIDVLHPAPSYYYETIGSVKRNGVRIQREYKEKQLCTIRFAIREYDIRLRQKICQAVCTWARYGGKLKVNDRDGEYLDCVCEGIPSVTSVRDWTETLEVTFAAYVIPYWQEDVPTTVSFESATLGGGNVFVPGNGGTVEVEMSFTPSETLAIGGWITFRGEKESSLHLDGFEFTQGKTITISYDENHIMQIKDGDNVSYLSHRTGTDDIIGICGQTNGFWFDSSPACSVIFSARGRWE